MNVTIAAEMKTKVADEVWIATALLHQEHPSREDFSIEEIVERARKEKINGKLRPGVYVHAQMHCVANRPPNPGRYRMLFETAPGRRRVYRLGDPYDRNREHSKVIPAAEDIPEKYHALLMWYVGWNDSKHASTGRFDALRALRGSGRGLYGPDPVAYVRQLRDGWE